VVPVPECEDWNTGTFFQTATLERVTDCLWAGAEVNARDNRRNTPLHFAASATNDPLIIRRRSIGSSQ
jgi:ankyrin repeat protein